MGRAAAWIVCVVFIVALGWPGRATAEDRVTVRGNYYREASTRVMQPTINVSVDVPDERFTVGAAYVLDAISSASIATGTTAVTGGDNVFTEIRHETTAFASSKLGDWGIGGFFRYSTETDYKSRSLGVSASRDLLQRTINLSLSYAYNFDRFGRIQANTRVYAPWCGGSQDVATCSDSGSGLGTNLVQVHYVAAGYTHALHKHVLGMFTAETAYTRGPMDNPYRGMQILGVTYETHPLTRTRVALAPAVRWIIPAKQVSFVVEPRYRYNVDTWNIQAHAPEIRLHMRFADHFRLRLRYRYYRQTAAFFWRDDGAYSEPTGLCTKDHVENCATADPKMSAWHSHTPGIQLLYELDGLSRLPGLGWTENGWISATYNHVFQSNRYGFARLGSLELSLAF